jgi:hypothetical protein
VITSTNKYLFFFQKKKQKADGSNTSLDLSTSNRLNIYSPLRGPQAKEPFLRNSSFGTSPSLRNASGVEHLMEVGETDRDVVFLDIG